jgi:hypothetical protein
VAPLSKVERRPGGLLIAEPRVAPRVVAPERSPRRAVDGAWLLHRRQRPAVSGELARDGDRDDCASFASSFERLPAGVQPSRALIGAGADDCRLALAALLERCARPEWAALVPGRFGRGAHLRVPVASSFNPSSDWRWAAWLTRIWAVTRPSTRAPVDRARSFRSSSRASTDAATRTAVVVPPKDDSCAWGRCDLGSRWAVWWRHPK